MSEHLPLVVLGCLTLSVALVASTKGTVRAELQKTSQKVSAKIAENPELLRIDIDENVYFSGAATMNWRALSRDSEKLTLRKTSASETLDNVKEPSAERFDETLQNDNKIKVSADEILENDSIKVNDGETSLGLLTLEWKQTGNGISIDKFVSSWMKDYPKFGYQIEESKVFGLLNEKAHFLELTKKNSETRLSQYVLKKNSHRFVFTCVSQKSQWATLRKECHRLIMSLKSTETPH
ncbi:MAG: hypothetical protein COT74_09380 [Bdellovibrionales bacterium CG10_big_fil_rev_8_21_14_0_10_45_34]|nr:MAG: hypothetical protein COT74_09380 [Bdellovibrionales bacterium CG10_big_fil_rev_8_21_14_0_10_45_34]